MSTLHFVHRRAVLGGLLTSALGGVALSPHPALAQADPLPSWNDGRAKQSILNFVAAVTREGSPDFVAVPQRIATFDNDGTLWVEQPIYVQLAFALDRVKALAPIHPDWKEKQPFKAALDGDMKALGEAGERGVMELMVATHAGMTTDEFTRIVNEWLSTARHPKFNRPYTDLVYQPMLELLLTCGQWFQDLHCIGWRHRVHAAVERTGYGVPPEQVIGSGIKTRFQMRGDIPVLFRLAEVTFIDDGTEKPVGINEHIGRRPIAAFGNSDGDLEMLQWVTKSSGRRLGLIVHHTDDGREYAYDRQSQAGRLDKALDAAAVNGWTVVDMKSDWKRVFKFQ